MAHRYAHPIEVTRTGETLDSLIWRATTYRVLDVLATWHLRDRWWESGDGQGASDRTYYRVLCASTLGEHVFEVYHDTTNGRWILDRAHD